MVRLVLLTLSASLLFTAGAVLGTLLSSVTFNPMPEGEASQHQAITPVPVCRYAQHQPTPTLLMIPVYSPNSTSY